MPEYPDGTTGERLTGDAYAQRFSEDFWKVGASGFWKLERRQSFLEPGSDSWAAFARGDWDEAVRLLDGRRSSLEEYYRKIADHGFGTWWVRVVEKPVTPYLQWEFHAYQLRAELGDDIRVIDVDRVRDIEERRRLPEIITLGDGVMYELVYDQDGLQEGGIRFTDLDLVASWRRFIQELHSTGEAVRSYYQREVVALVPPRR